MHIDMMKITMLLSLLVVFSIINIAIGWITHSLFGFYPTVVIIAIINIWMGYKIGNVRIELPIHPEEWM